jgi:hypothetical protein
VTTNDELKTLIENIPNQTRDVFREMAVEIATTAAASAVSAHRTQCDRDRHEAEEARRKEIRISKKSALWWIRMAGAVLILMSASAGAWAGFREIIKMIQ